MNLNIGLGSVPFTNARANLSSIVDALVRNEKPAIAINRKNKEEVLVLKKETQKFLLAAYRLKAEIHQELDSSYTLSLDLIDIAENGTSLEDALQSVVVELKVYAADYADRLPLFINAPNRQGHLPFVMRVLLADSDSEIKGFIDVANAS